MYVSRLRCPAWCKLLTYRSDKSTATTFQLVHRPQDDPLIHDETSNSMVFRPLAPSQAHKIKSRSDLESELFGSSSDTSSITSSNFRANEGEAAEYGVYFDDTEYDYMQHIRGLNSGTGDGESFFVEATEGKNRGKGKNKISLEDALRDSTLQDEASETYAPSTIGSHLGSQVTFSTSLQRGIEAQQDVPDALSGFQPDMDPRLREVLEALDDEAYVDDEEDIFGEIAKDRRELSLDEFEDTLYNDVDDGEDDDDDGWESDVTEKPQHEYKDSTESASSQPLSASDLSMLNAPLHDVPDVAMDDVGASINPDASSANNNDNNGEWMNEFRKFKQDQQQQQQKLQKAAIATAKPGISSRTPALDADLQSSSRLTSSSSLISGGGPRKKRKGALTSSSAYSMSSSALARTEGLTTLDRRFEKIEEEYCDNDDEEEEEGDGVSSILSKPSTIRSGISSSSSTTPHLVPATTTTRGDFDTIMDDFLGGYHSVQNKGKRVKRGGYQTGMEQLDEVRRGLGPAKLKAGSKT